ncbi:hypothetical protein HanPI659440_Chr02g0087971 [Helianthus annuus]|nr:hypothetical protein HanPI659440_Chr02g0087971 [Helianthus annuus]
MLFDMIGGSILVTSRLQAVVLRMVDFGGVTAKFMELHNVSVITMVIVHSDYTY